MPYKVFFVLALTVLVIRAGPLSTESAETEVPLRRVRRIIGGNLVEQKDFPYMVSIQTTLSGTIFRALPDGGYEHFCGGTLISASWVLTAAHCMYAFATNGTRLSLTDPAIWKVRLGTKVLRPTNKELFKSKLDNSLNIIIGNSRYLLAYYPVEKVILHPSYSSAITEHDLALLKLKVPIRLRFFKKDVRTLVPALRRIVGAGFPPANKNCMALGWGRSCSNCAPEANLKAVQLPVLAHEDCLAGFTSSINLTQSLEFCAGFINGVKGISQGDDGGPLVCEFEGRKVLAGVAAAPVPSEPEKYPVIYTRVAAYSDWILEVMRKN